MNFDPTEIWRKFKLPIVLGGGGILFIGFSTILIVETIQTNKPSEFLSNQDVLGDSKQASVSANPEKLIHVDVEGGVRAPGLYVLPSASRIQDAIDKAGGLSDEADGEMIAKQLNRAGFLIDGAKVYIPKKNDEFSSTSYNCDPLLQRQSTSQNGFISINSASLGELDSLSGVGPVTAQKIITNRPYQALEELVSKKVIGNALFDKIKGNLSL